MLLLVLSLSGFCITSRFHGNGPTRVFLFRSKASEFKICHQSSEKTKKKCEYCHSSQRNYQKKLKRLIFSGNFKDHEDDKHSPSEFYYPEDLETFDAETETGITESQEATDDFINQQKSANTNKKTATDMNTLIRYLEANGMKNEKIESLPAFERDHLLLKFFWNARKKNGEE